MEGVERRMSSSSATSVITPSGSGGGGSTAEQNFALGLAAAIGSPVLYAVVNCVDKAILAKSVKSVEGYAPVVGLMDIIIG